MFFAVTANYMLWHSVIAWSQVFIHFNEAQPLHIAYGLASMPVEDYNTCYAKKVFGVNFYVEGKRRGVRPALQNYVK